MATEIRIVGDKPNLRWLDDDIRKLENIDSLARVSFEPTASDSASLGNAEQVALIISILSEVGVGVASAAIYDGLRSAISAARRRGIVRMSGDFPDSEESGDENTTA